MTLGIATLSIRTEKCDTEYNTQHNDKQLDNKKVILKTLSVTIRKCNAQHNDTA